MGQEKSTKFTLTQTDDVGKAAAILSYPHPDDGVRIAIVDIQVDPPKSSNSGARPWCTVIIGCDNEELLDDAVAAYDNKPEGPKIPCKRYEERRRQVMRAINEASQKYQGG